jgi:hypothetical protein
MALGPGLAITSGGRPGRMAKAAPDPWSGPDVGQSMEENPTTCALVSPSALIMQYGRIPISRPGFLPPFECALKVARCGGCRSSAATPVAPRRSRRPRIERVFSFRNLRTAARNFSRSMSFDFVAIFAFRASNGETLASRGSGNQPVLRWSHANAGD